MEAQQNGGDEVMDSATGGSDFTVSPKVSSIGGGEDSTGSKHSVPTAFSHVDYSAPGLDTHHWSGVKKSARDLDSRSVGSSLAAERDAQSVYDVTDAPDGEGSWAAWRGGWGRGEGWWDGGPLSEVQAGQAFPVLSRVGMATGPWGPWHCSVVWLGHQMCGGTALGWWLHRSRCGDVTASHCPNTTRCQTL